MEYSPHPEQRQPSTVHAASVQTLLRDARHFVDETAEGREAWRGSAPFVLVRRGERNTVLRARVPGAGDGASADATSVVLKLAGADTDLADADLRYMVALTGTGVTPDVIGELGGAAGGGFAMVDAGEDTLTHRLERGTRTDVLQGMRRTARAYARLHVEGRSLLARTEAMRQAAMTRELGAWVDGLPRALSWMDLGPDDARVRRATTRISAAWYAGRDALTLTHGDPAPGNVLFLANGDACLVDFEYAAPRHPAYDVTAWDVLCPLPNDIVQAFHAEYVDARAALGWPMAAADESFDAILAYRALAMLAWLPDDARQGDLPWVASWSARQAVLHTLEQLARRCEGDGALQRLAEAARAAAGRWRREWPEVGDVLPPWPALRAPVA